MARENVALHRQPTYKSSGIPSQQTVSFALSVLAHSALYPGLTPAVFFLRFAAGLRSNRVSCFKGSLLRNNLGLRRAGGYCSFAYSALACFRIGMSESASFQVARKS